MIEQTMSGQLDDTQRYKARKKSKIIWQLLIRELQRLQKMKYNNIHIYEKKGNKKLDTMNTNIIPDDL